MNKYRNKHTQTKFRHTQYVNSPVHWKFTQNCCWCVFLNNQFYVHWTSVCRCEYQTELNKAKMSKISIFWQTNSVFSWDQEKCYLERAVLNDRMREKQDTCLLTIEQQNYYIYQVLTFKSPTITINNRMSNETKWNIIQSKISVFYCGSC